MEHALADYKLPLADTAAPPPRFIFPLCGDLPVVSRWRPLTETAEGALSIS